MENNKQNSVLLIIIAVATLLVAVVGATFAYFTASNPSGSTAEVKTKSGKMEIEFADGTDAIKAEKQTGFEPSNTVLVDKTFTITGDNVTTSKPNNNGTLGTESSLVMPFIVSLDYTTTFINNELHVLVKKMNADSEYTQKISYTGATLLKNSTTAPATLKSIADFQEYYDYTVGKGTTDAKESKETKELVYGEFKDTQNASLADRQVTLRLVMIFPDTGDNQDYNKSATFNGILKVTTTANGSAR
ncbi:MAG: hypothetical protein MR765_07455 [Tenericutes bacterium]|nr:hypothetical protein [Mycoplasmatota bacterium]